MRVFPLPLYLCEITVLHCRHRDLMAASRGCHPQVRTIVKEMADDAAPPLGASMYRSGQRKGSETRRTVVIFVESEQRAAEKRLTAVHEATHAAGSILEGICHEIKPADDEPHAYLVEWITRCVWQTCSV